MALFNKDSPIGKMLGSVEGIFYMAVGIILVATTIIVLIQTIGDITRMSLGTMEPVHLANVLNDILFAIIILELFSTVVSHVLTGGFQLKAFLIIGIISSVRRILVYGAQLSTSIPQTNSEFRRGIMELSVDTGVVLILSVALYINTLGRNKPTSVDH